VQIGLLGGFVVERGGQAVDVKAWRLRKARTVVKLLALARDQRLHRDLLLDTLGRRIGIRRPRSTIFTRRCTSPGGRSLVTGVTTGYWSCGTTSWCCGPTASSRWMYGALSG